MRRRFIMISTAVLTISLMLSLCSFPVLAAPSDAQTAEEVGEIKAKSIGEEQNERSITRWQLSENTVVSKSIYSYSSVSLTKDGTGLYTDARRINGTTYVALRSFINELTSMNVSYYSARRTMEISGEGLSMSATDGSNIVYANGRVLYSLSPNVIMNNGRMYTPLSVLAKALGLTYSDASSRAYLSGMVRPLTSGSVFYDTDAVYWLSRIISAESRGEPLLGQIAVGNVVLNRVRSPLYPNTIWGVIFDKKYGVQFSPILNGTIYNAPSASAIEAAKICLEGYSITTRALFFLQPRLSTSSWIPKSREYIFSIGNHDFYM